MHRGFPRITLALLGAIIDVALLSGAVLARSLQESKPDAAASKNDGWTIPPGAATETSPVAATPQTLVAGRALFQKNCQRCHGPKGFGDGPDADPDYMADMDLTNPKRAPENPDGVVFHKVWNGRQDPKMPAFSEKLTKEQVWTVVAYVQTLRKK